MASNYNFDLNFKINRDGLDKAKQEIASLKAEIQSNPAKFNIEASGIDAAIRQVEIFQKAMEKAFNQDLGRLNTTKFLQELRKADSSLIGLKSEFNKLGIDASNSFNKIEQSIEKTGLSLKKTNKLVDSMGVTIANTIKWNVASGVLDTIGNSILGAIGYTKALDNSLNNIRIVTGKNNDEMKEFAKNANEAARALGRTTTEYTDASLIYFQQGKTANEVQELSKATLIAANVTGESTADSAELLTAALNGYNLEANKAMEITDKFAAVGAASGSDFKELAIGFSKVASMASTAGVSVDQLNGMLATTSTVTREAPESIGTSFKTIFGRINDLKAGKKDEDGWAMGDVQKALQKAGMSLLDYQGRLKDTGTVIEEIGDKWTTFNKETQMAISVAMAGNRQQNRLIALYNNWDMYKQQKDISKNGSEGAAEEQNLIRMDSIEAHAKKLKAALEELWGKVIDSEVIKTVIDLLTSAVDHVNKLVDAFGGIGPVLGLAFALMTKFFDKSNKISGSIGGLFDKYEKWKEKKDTDGALINNPTDPKKAGRNKEEYNIRKYLTTEEHQQYKEAREALEVEEKKLKVLNEQLKTKEKDVSAAKGTVTGIKDNINKNSSAAENIQKEISNLEKSLEVKTKSVEIAAQEKRVIDEIIADKRIELEESEKIGLSEIQNKEAKITALEIQSKDIMLSEEERALIGQNILQEKEELLILQQKKAMKADLSAYIEQLTAQSKSLEIEGKEKATIEKTILEEKEKLALLEKEGALLNSNLTKEEKELAKQEAINEKIKTRTLEQKEVVAESGAQDTMSTLSNKADTVGKVSNVVSALSTLAIGLVSVTGAYKEYTAAGDDAEKQSDAITGALSGVGMALMMIPVPWVKVVGAVLMGVAALKDFIFQGSGVQKILKENNELLEKTAKNIDESKNKLKNIISVENDFKNLQQKMKFGAVSVDDLNTEDLKAYYELSSKIAEADPDLVSYYDDQGRAVLNLTKNINDLKEAQAKQVREANQLRVDNKANFAKEYSETISEAQKAIGEKKRILDIINNDDGSSLTTYNYTHGTNYSQEDTTKLTAEIQTQQAKIKETSENIGKNIVNALFESSKSYSELNSKQKDMVRALFDVEKATELAYNPKLLASYEDGVKRVIDVVGRAGNIQETIKKNIEKITALKARDPKGNADQIENLEKENSALEKQIKDVSELANKFESLGKVKQRFVTDGMAFLDPKEGDMNTALDKLTEFYSKNDPIKAGPMSIDKLRGITGFQKSYKLDSGEDIQKNLDENHEETDYHRKQRQYNLQDTFNATSDEDEKEKIKVFREEDDVVKQLEATRDDYIEGSKQAAIATIAEKDANANLEEAYWSELSTMADTVDGYNQIADAYNNNLGLLGELNSALGENVDSGDMTKEQMDQVADSLEGIADQIPGLSDALEAYRQEGASAFGDLAEYAQQAQSQLADNNGRMYALMHKDDVEYYQKFVSLNREATDKAFIEYGVRAQNYANYGEYEKALHGAMEKGKLGITQQAINRMILWNDDAANKHAEDMEAQKNNTANTAKANVTVWSVMTNSSLSIWDRLGYAWKSLLDWMHNLGAKMANGFIDIWNACASVVGGVVNKMIDGINGLNDMVPDALKKEFGVTTTAHVDWGKVNHVEMSNYAGEYLANLAKNYSTGVDDLGFKYGDPMQKVDHKAPSDYGINTPKDNGGGGGPVANPNAGDSKSNPKDDMHEKLDPLHDTNLLLEEQEGILKHLQNLEKDLYGKAKLDNLNQQNAALERKKALLQQQLTILQQSEAQRKSELLSKGVSFDATGAITNYNALLKSREDAANAITDNNRKDDAQDATKLIKEQMDEYEDWHFKVKFDKEQAIDEVNELQRSIKMEKFEYVINIKLEMGEEREKLLKFLIDTDTEFTDSADKYKNSVSEIKDHLQDVKNIKKQISKIEEDDTLSTKEKLEQMQKYEDKLIEAVSAANDLQESLEKINEDGIKSGLDLLDQEINKYESVNKALDHIMNTYKLIGKGQDYADLNNVYEAQQESLQGQITEYNEIFKYLKDYRDELKKGSEEWEYANAQVIKMSENIDKLVEETLKSYQEQLKTSLEGIVKTLNENLFNGSTYDEVSDAFDRLKEKQDKYLSTAEKIVWVGEMQAKVQNEIDSSTNVTSKAELQKYLDEELDALKNKDTLSKTEVERAQKLYQITLDQIALEEARNNKTTTRLVRDGNGNWSYQYVEDTSAVAKAQTQLSSDLKDLMDTDSENLQKNEQNQLQTKKEFMDKIQDIVKKGLNGEYDSQEDFYAALKLAQANFNTDMKELIDEYNELVSNTSESSMASVLDAYASNKDGLDLYSSDSENLMKTLANSIGTDWTKVSDLIKSLNSGNASDFALFCQDMGISWNITNSTLTSGFAGTAGSFTTDFADVVSTAATELDKNLTNIYTDISTQWSNCVVTQITSNDSLDMDTQNTVDSIMNKWQEYQDKVTEVIQENQQAIYDYNNSTDTSDDSPIDILRRKTERLMSTNDALEDSFKSVSKTIKRQWSDLADAVARYTKSQEKSFDSLISKAKSYAKELQKDIEKMQELNSGVSYSSDYEDSGDGGISIGSSSTSGSYSGGSGSSSYSSSSSSSSYGPWTMDTSNVTPFVPTTGTPIRVRAGRTWYYDSEGNGPTGDTTAYSNQCLYVVNTSDNWLGYALGTSPSISSALGWVNIHDLQGFDTGGYTGNVSGDGALALLHEKEIVLNKTDTQNILDAVTIVRDYASMIKGAMGSSAIATASSTGQIQQTVQINADFSGVRSSGEIEEAFNNLANRAAQYAMKKN